MSFVNIDERYTLPCRAVTGSKGSPTTVFTVVFGHLRVNRALHMFVQILAVANTLVLPGHIWSSFI